MKTTRPQYQSERGFTVVEILIVLAIIGIILLIVFLAIPAAQRNARNVARKEAANYIMGELNAYKADFGHYPLYNINPTLDERPAFVASLRSGGPSQIYDIRYIDNDAPHEYPYRGIPDFNQAFDQISIQPGHSCNKSGAHPGDDDFPLITSVGGDYDFNQFVIWTLLEDNQVYCLDTRD